MGQKNSILHAITREAIKMRINAHCQNSLPGLDPTLKVAQIFFVNSSELTYSFMKIIGES